MQGYFKRVFGFSFTAVREAMPKCMPEEFLALDNLMSLKSSNRWGLTPHWTYQVRLSQVRILPYAFSISPMVRSIAGNGKENYFDETQKQLLNGRYNRTSYRK